MLDALTEYALKEWRVIKGAPVAFVTCVALSFLIAIIVISWHYGGIIEIQGEMINNQKERIDAARDNFADAQRQLAEIRSSPTTTPAIETLQQKLKEGVSKLTARRLSTEQKRLISNSLVLQNGTQYRLDILYPASCDECELFAGDFYHLVDELPGWTVNFGGGFGLTNRPDGIVLTTKNIVNLTPTTKMMTQALNLAGIPFALEQDGRMPDAAIYLFVGSVPKN
jgi:hypothetical protein